MPQFDESKVINALHLEKAEVGKKYWVSESIYNLKKYVEENNVNYIEKIIRITEDDYPFHSEDKNEWQYLYPYEEPPKQRMTNRQLVEWLAKGNGQMSYTILGCIYDNHHAYKKQDDNEYVDDDIRIRSWDSEEWIRPTIDIYERDCKGGKE